MTYSELIDAVRCQYSTAVLESVQFETNRKSIDADDLFWNMFYPGNLANAGCLDVIGWRNKADSINDDGQRAIFCHAFLI